MASSAASSVTILPYPIMVTKLLLAATADACSPMILRLLTKLGNSRLKRKKMPLGISMKKFDVHWCKPCNVPRYICIVPHYISDPFSLGKFE